MRTLRRWFLYLLATLSIAVMAVSVAAIPQNVTDAEFSWGPNETRTDSQAQAMSVEGGNISELNISAERQSGWWQAIYGSLTLNFTLEDASGNVFYNWGLANATGGEVYFSNDSIVLWGVTEVVNASRQNLTFAQTTHGWAASPSVDNLTNTYRMPEEWVDTDYFGHQAFGITGGETFAANSTPATFMPSGSGGSTFNATMLWQNASHPLGAGERMDYPLFAGLVHPNLDTVKSGINADFSVLLPTLADSGTEDYFVFVELT